MEWNVWRFLARSFPKSHGRLPIRWPRRSFQPSVELLEQRQLLSGTPSNTNLTTDTNSPVVGQTVQFWADVRPASGSGTPTGWVKFYNGPTELETDPLQPGMMGPRATYTTNSLPQGTYTITATYQGDDTYDQSTGSLSETVSTVPTWTSLSSSSNPADAGTAVTFTAYVNSSSGTPSGTVEFKEGSTLLGTGTLGAGSMMGAQATFSISTLSAGTHAITAYFEGTSTYQGSTSSILSQVISGGSSSSSTTTSLSSSSNPALATQPVTFTATVSAMMGGTPTGTVTFQDGTNQLGTVSLTSSGQASYTTSTLTVGSHNITAQYNPMGSFTSSSANWTETINPAGNHPPVLTNPGNQTNTAGDAVYLALYATDPDGDPLTYSGGGLPPGLNFYPNTGVISGRLPVTSTGTYTVNVGAFDGHGGSDSQTFTWTVQPAPLQVHALAVNGVEGSALTSVPLATFTDPLGNTDPSRYSATVNWDDGSSGSGTITATGGTFQVAASHAAAEEGGLGFHVSVTATATGLRSTVAGNAHIADAPLSVGTSNPGLQATQGVLFSGTVASFRTPTPWPAAATTAP